MKLYLQNIYTYVEFGGNEETLREVFRKRVHTHIGVRAQGYQFVKAFKLKKWDGYTDFYEFDKDRFPSGLLEQVKELLYDLQNRYTFQFDVVDERSEAFLEPEDVTKEIKLLDKKMGTITLRDYQQEAVEESIVKYNGLINIATNGGKTEIASGIIQELLPYLEKGETIAFFTHSKEIFHQTADRMKERLNIPIGKIGAGSFDVKQVNVVMIPTVNANLKDPSEGVTLTQKQIIYKKVALQVLPKLSTTPNKRTMLFLMLEQMKVKTKADQAFKEELTKIYQEHKSDSELMMKLNAYNVKYQEILRKKNEKKYDKYYKMKDFLQSIACFIGDEFHHAKSDTWYTSLLQCENALYKIGLTGSIDHSDPLTVQRLKALCGEILIKVSNDYLIERGISARPTINSIPIANPTDLEEENQYQVAYDKGIVNNEFRNTLVAKITEKCYHDNKGILIIVNFLQHGNNISELLESYDIPHEFIYGDLETDKRKQYLSDMKSGKLKVLIATSLIDEGVDISGINTLIIAAGGKSLRQVLQRIGRALRRKEEDNTTQIYDFIDMTNKFLYKHYLERRSIYDNENFEVREIK